jgi:hypothetical protein
MEPIFIGIHPVTECPVYRSWDEETQTSSQFIRVIYHEWQVLPNGTKFNEVKKSYVVIDQPNIPRYTAWRNSIPNANGEGKTQEQIYRSAVELTLRHLPLQVEDGFALPDYALTLPQQD